MRKRKEEWFDTVLTDIHTEWIIEALEDAEWQRKNPNSTHCRGPLHRNIFEIDGYKRIDKEEQGEE